MFYLADTDKPRLFIKSNHKVFETKIYVGTSGPTEEHKDNLKRVQELIERMNNHISEGKFLQIYTNPNKSTEIYIKWSDIPWDRWELVLSNKFRFLKELIGYKQTITFENADWQKDHPKGSIWVKWESRKVREQNLYRHGSDSNAKFLPAEIVEQWEPKYKEDKTIAITNQDVMELLGIPYDPEVKIKLI